MKRALFLLVVIISLFFTFSALSEVTENGLYYRIENNEAIITRYSGSEEILRIPSYIDGCPVTEICLLNQDSDGNWIENSNTKKVILPETIVTLRGSSFLRMTELKEVVGLEYVQKLLGYNFIDTKITTLTFSDRLSYVGIQGFACLTLNVLTIPDNIIFDNENPLFYNNFALRQIDLLHTGDEPTLVKDGPALYTADMKQLLQYPSSYTGLVTYHIPEGVEKIAKNAFSINDAWNTKLLQDVTVPSSLISIQKESLYTGIHDYSPVTGKRVNKICPVVHVFPGTSVEQFCRDHGYTYYLRQAGNMTFQERINQILEETITSGMTDYEKAWALNCWLVDNAVYDDTYTYYYPNGILFEGKGTCQSFFLTYNLLLEQLHIDSRAVAVNDKHGINAVWLNGETCYIDTTWNCSLQTDNYFGMNRDMVIDIYSVKQEFDLNARKNTGYINYHKYHTGDYDQLLSACVELLDEAINSRQERCEWTVEDILQLRYIHMPEANHNYAFDCAIVAAYMREYSPEDSVFLSANYIDNRVVIDISYSYPFPEDFEIRRTNTGISIEHYTGSDQDIIIPNEIWELPVVAIGNRAFSGLTALKTVAIPETVVSIGAYAFFQSGLEEIQFPAALTTIGDYAFNGCENLKEVSIPANVTVGEYLFGNCYGLEKATVACQITNMSKGMFYCCFSLREISLPSSMEIIPSAMLGECHSLASLTLPQGIKRIESWGLCSCAFKELQIPDSVEYIGYLALASNQMESIRMPASLKVIDDSAFENALSLKHVSFNQGLESIGERAFYCAPIEEIYIPASVSDLNPSCFARCDNIRSITVAPDNLYYSSENNTLFNKNKTVLMRSAVSNEGIYIVPETVKEIGYDAFAFTAVSEVQFLGSIKSIDDEAFFSCKNLTQIAIPEGVEAIPNSCFANCTSLCSISLPETLKELEFCAFIDCTSLINFTLPNNVSQIGNNALPNKISTFWIPLSMTEISSDLLPSTVGTIYVHRNVNFIGLNNLKQAPYIVYGTKGTYAEQYARENNFTFIDFATTVEEGAFHLPASLLTIEESAFNFVPAASAIRIPDQCIAIGEKAFSGSDNLKYVIIPESVRSIGENAFNKNVIIITPEGSYASDWGLQHGYLVY